jgi:hypothetical protein
MSIWTLILVALACFALSFAAAHFTERLLFFVVGWANRRRDNRRSNQEPASSDERAAAVVASGQIGEGNAESIAPTRMAAEVSPVQSVRKRECAPS